MEGHKRCTECHADLNGNEIRCPWCEHIIGGPPPLPVLPEKPDWRVDVAILLAAPIVCWIISMISIESLFLAAVICPLFSTLLLLCRWADRVKKSVLVELGQLMLVGGLIMVGLVALCFFGCAVIAKGLR